LGVGIIKEFVPVVAAITGGLLVMFAGALQQWMTTVRSREEKKAENEQRVLQQQRDLRKQTLLELQDALAELICSAVWSSFLKQGRKNAEVAAEAQGVSIGHPIETLKPSIRFLKSQTKVHVLLVRLKDEQARNLVEVVAGVAGDVKNSAAYDDRSKGLVGELYKNFYAANDRIGVLVRELC